ncbi:hypothetical protein B0H17DRAFT_1203335 [Mycena rosella]|uniref:Uncharacterized protein n=1 Tax=Mycena rosella TaxID=1033263 RepID=A0AAD7GH32_MYCRO|nr:hypothetical protein B0H17DRAFT_1203335 [Mycena rosella]
MAELLDRPCSPNGVLMYRTNSAESTESTESPFASVLNTPADEHILNFDALDPKLHPEQLETLVRTTDYGRPPRVSVSLSRQFSKALDEANKSASSNGLIFRAQRSQSVERIYYPSPDLLETPESPDLMSFASPEMPFQPMELQRVQTPEPPISDVYNAGSPDSIIRTTPRGRPPLRRDIFSPAPKPIPFDIEGESTPLVPEFTPRAHSTFRHRKGIYVDLNDSITGKPSEILPDMEFQNVSLDAALDDDHKILAIDNHDVSFDSYCDVDGPTLPELSPLLPLQLVLFPLWCVLIGGAILLCPSHLHALAFPASTSRTGYAPTALAHRLLAFVLPLSAPPTAIRIFAHWATVAHLHVAIFLASLVGIAYVAPPLGALLAGASAVGFVRAWHDFSPDDEGGVDEDGDFGLGGEVRQMLYQVLAPGCGFQDGDALRKVGEKYVLVRAPRVETRAEILAAGGLSEEYEEDEDDDDESE